MTLTSDEWDRLEFLLGKDHVVGIDQREMDEIIHLIKTEYPDSVAMKTRKDWIDLGLGMVGARLLIRQARLNNPPETFHHPEKVYADIYADAKK